MSSESKTTETTTIRASAIVSAPEAIPSDNCWSLDISLLPQDIFWLILELLKPVDIACCFAVCRAWNEAFGNPFTLLPVLKKFFPFAREVRKLQEDGSFGDPYPLLATGNDIRTIFSRVACRYHHLNHGGKPRSVQEFALCEDFGAAGEREFFPVQPWESHTSQILTVDWHFPEAFWTYEDGLLVFPSADYHCFLLMNLEEDDYGGTMVPFSITGKVIRRVRLRHRVLVIEWAEPIAFHWLNDTDGVHRHFATAFDVRRRETSSTDNNVNDERGSTWSVTLRNEWKIMSLGHPLSEIDRFYSSHTNTHYVVYTWQPNRSLYTADDDAPIECLTVWDISNPSTYRPSLDPTGRVKEELYNTANGDSAGPFMVSQFSFRELGFYLVRQRGRPRIQNLKITEDAQSIEITESVITQFPLRPRFDPHAWVVDVHKVTFPASGIGPCWRRKSSSLFPPYRGNGSLRSSYPLTAASNGKDNGNEPWYTIISEAADLDAQVFFRLHFLPTLLPELHMALSIRTPSSCLMAHLPEFFRLFAKGKIRGNERFLVGEDYMGQLVVYRFD